MVGMKPRFLNFLILIVPFVEVINSLVERADMFRFGRVNNDTEYMGHHVYRAVPLTQGFKYFNTVYNTLYIHDQGIISFKDEPLSMTPRCEQSSDPAIYPFWAHNLATIEGQIFYRQTNNSIETAKASDEVNIAFPRLGPLRMQWVLIVTWEDTTPHGNMAECVMANNTFQAILTTDGVYSFVIVYYNQIQYTTDHFLGPDCSTDNVRGHARVGINFGILNQYLNVQGSCTRSIANIGHSTNVCWPGKYVFKVEKFVPFFEILPLSS